VTGQLCHALGSAGCRREVPEEGQTWRFWGRHYADSGDGSMAELLVVISLGCARQI